MPFIPASLVVHLAFASLVSVAWAFLSMRLFRIRHPATRALVLAVSVLLPAGGFLVHLIYPHSCAGFLSTLSHIACLTSSALGEAGILLLSSSLVVTVSQAAATWATQRAVVRHSIPVEAMKWDNEGLTASLRRAIAGATGPKNACPPAVMVTRRPGVFCTVGVFRPVILISEEFCRAMDEEELKAALAHEMAHIRRSDNLIALASTLLRALTFFSPAAYFAIRQYMSEREKAADDVAVATTGDRLALASAIVKVARAATSAVGANAAGASDSGVVTRVQRLIDAGKESEDDNDVLGGRVAYVLTSMAGLAAIALYLC